MSTNLLRPLSFLSRRTGSRRVIVVFVVSVLTAIASRGRPLAGQTTRTPDFNSEVRPILSDKCFACHGPDEKHRAADLRLDLEQTAHESGAVVPGKPDASELMSRVTRTDDETKMPPAKSGKKLTPAEIDTLRRWIASGGKYAQHWAYVPPRREPTPTATAKPEEGAKPDESPLAGGNWIDAFVVAKLQQVGEQLGRTDALKPSPQADRRTLIRRLTFDLTGLPPSPVEVEAFIADKDPKAYEKLVKRLLASPHYGERMAAYWLDLVRYADTVGYHGDQEHHASPYRDWVIDALNDNMPFDQFTREQLAGDLLPGSTTDQKIATCYNRLLQTSHEGGVQPKEYLAIYAADRVRNVSVAWMGATIGCAQCHDHKFDPYTTKDFYSLAAVFADVDEERHLRGEGADATPTRRFPEIAVHTRRERQRLDELERRIAASKDAGAPTDDATKKQLDQLVQQRDALKKAERRVMVTQALPTPRTVRVLPRGNWLDESGPIVAPAAPGFLFTGSTMEAAQPTQTPPTTDGRRFTRLDLANWLTDPDPKSGVGGLTARVFVNRLWHLFFGEGLSRSLEDFGGQGEPPTHPELLDRLALELLDSRWNVKHVIELIVTSRTYRQSSRASAELRAVDPQNRWLARQSSWRLPAESIRDTALWAGGLLIDEVGGPSAKPYQPAGYYRHLNFPKREYASDKDSNQWRRGVYVHWQRQFLHPMLKAFDAPSREECVARRPRSNTPLAALVLLNDPTFIEAARALGQRTLRDGGATDAERLSHAFRLATSRTPDPEEAEALEALLQRERTEFRANAEAAESLVKIGIAPAPADIPRPELAAWTAVGRAILNLSETFTRE